MAEQVYKRISVDELASVVRACGFTAHVEHAEGREFVWVNVAGRNTLISLVGTPPQTSIVLFIAVFSEITANATQANDFNHKKANWWTVYVNDDRKPVVTMPIDVEGVTREHLAAKIFLWEYGVDEAISHFSR